MRRLVAAVALAALLFPSIAAARPSGDAVYLVTPDPHWGDVATFGVITDEPYPVVSVYCYQDEALVFSASGPTYGPAAPFSTTLASLSWTGGSASCSALLRVLRHHNVVTLAETAFDVAG